MCKKEVHYAFIDNQNLYLAIRAQGWVLSYKRFRQYLKDKYRIRKAFIFVGYLPRNEGFYSLLRNIGYEVILKPTLILPNGKVKGNVDTELVLQAMIEYPNYDKAILVSGDGDFHCLIRHLASKGKFLRLMIPNRRAYSSLFIEYRPIMSFMNGLREKLEHKKERE